MLGADLVNRKTEEKWKKWYLFYRGGSVEKLQQLVGELDAGLEKSGKVLSQIAMVPELQGEYKNAGIK